MKSREKKSHGEVDFAKLTSPCNTSSLE